MNAITHWHGPSRYCAYLLPAFFTAFDVWLCVSLTVRGIFLPTFSVANFGKLMVSTPFKRWAWAWSWFAFVGKRMARRTSPNVRYIVSININSQSNTYKFYIGIAHSRSVLRRTQKQIHRHSVQYRQMAKKYYIYLDMVRNASVRLGCLVSLRTNA